MDTKILHEIGLTKGEIKVYLALLRIGSKSTGPIAKESQISRSKLYTILDKLEKKGLVSHVEKNGTAYFQAVEPSKVKDYLKEKKENLRQLEIKFESILPNLENMYKSKQSQKVTVYQGTKGLITAHEHLYLKLKKGDEYFYLGVPKYQSNTLHLYWQRDHLRRIKEGIRIKALFNKDTPREIVDNRNSFKGCDSRYMPTNLKTPSFFLIYKDTVMIGIPSDDPISIEIVNQQVADSFKSYFQEFWKKSKKLKS